MKAITICEPFASAIVFGGKDIENRRRAMPLFGPALIHAGKSLTWYEFEMCQWVHKRWRECPPAPVAAMHKFQSRHGKVIGIAYFGEPFKLEDRHSSSVWATGPWCLPVLAVRALSKPFPARGQQGVFYIPADDLPAEVFELADQLTEQCRGHIR